MPLDLDAVPGPLDLDQTEATSPPGMLSQAWNFMTKPLGEHSSALATASRLDQERMLAGADRIGLGGAMRTLSAVTPLSPLQGASEHTSILDLATIPAVAYNQATSVPGRALTGGARIMEVAQGMGLSAEALAGLNEARQTGDWSKVPTAVVRGLFGALGLRGGSGAADDAARLTEGKAARFSGAISDTPAVGAVVDDTPIGFGPGAGSQSAGRAPVAPPRAPSTATAATPPAPALASTRWAVSPGTSTMTPPAPPPPSTAMADRFRNVRQTMDAKGDMSQILGGGAKAPPGATEFSLPGGFTGIHNPKTGTYVLKGPNGEKVTGKIGQDILEMTSIGKGTAKDSRSAIQALRELGESHKKPVYFTSTNLSTDGGKFRSRMIERGDLIQDQKGFLLKGTGASPEPVVPSAAPAEGDDLGKALEDSLALAQKVPNQIMGQGAPRLTKKGEEGFFRPNLVTDALKAANRGVGDFLRAAVAGDIPTAIRNVQSGLRMVGQAMIENPMAAAHQKLVAARLRAKGQHQAAAEADRAAQFFMETAKAFPRATWEEGAATLADAMNLLRGKGSQAGSAFNERLHLMESFGDKKLAKKLADFSSTSVGDASNPITRGLMFFNILGDRFINRTYLRAGTDAVQKLYGAASPAALEQMAASSPAVRKHLQEFLIDTGSEAFRASWQNSAASGRIKTLITALDSTPLGLVVQPFAKAFFANMLPNIAEKIPMFVQLHPSKRVRNSFDYVAKKKLVESLQAGAAGNPAVQKQISALRAEMRTLAQDGIYHPSKIYARMTMGPLAVLAAVYTRLQRGDDGTEFDQIPIELGPDGKATKVATFTSQAGEDLPFWYLGDRIAHEMLAAKSGKPSKYQGAAGKTSIEGLLKALHGSRGGYNNPAFDLIGGIFGGKKQFDDQYLDRTVRAIAEDMGRMAGSGAWVGGTWRRLTAAADPAEAQNRRADVTEAKGPLARVKEAALEGVQSQIPKNSLGIPDRTQLPPSISWAHLKHGKQVDTLEPLKGGSIEDASKLQAAGRPIAALFSLLPGASRSEVSRLDRFANEHQGQISLSEILPRRTQQPAYDELVLKHLREGLERKALPALESGKIDQLSPEAQITWFRMLPKIREQAMEKAARDFKKLTGELPEGVQAAKDKKKQKRVERRETRRELRGVGY